MQNLKLVVTSCKTYPDTVKMILQHNRQSLDQAEEVVRQLCTQVVALFDRNRKHDAASVVLSTEALRGCLPTPTRDSTHRANTTLLSQPSGVAQVPKHEKLTRPVKSHNLLSFNHDQFRRQLSRVYGAMIFAVADQPTSNVTGWLALQGEGAVERRSPFVRDVRPRSTLS